MRIGAYEGNSGRELAAQYESISQQELFAPIEHLLPKNPASILDIGAGSGRDAAWFARKGHTVLAVEPSEAMRTYAQNLHCSSMILWLDDCLPALNKVYHLGTSFDGIFASGVWMHIHPSKRDRAFRKITGLLKPGGNLFISLRLGPADKARMMFPVSSEEIHSLAQSNGMSVVSHINRPDLLGRTDISWEQLVLRLHDDGTLALPLLRHVVLNDAKSSTYKLGLLRSVARVADGSQGMAKYNSDTGVSIPLGLVALYWLRLYHPLIQSNLPQAPGNKTGSKGLGFIDDHTWQIVSQLACGDFRVGARFVGEHADAVNKSIRKAVATINNKPAFYMTYPGSKDPIFPVTRVSRHRFNITNQLIINEEYLRSFGSLFVPLSIWRTMVRFDAWIEPSLVAEWIRLMENYAKTQGRELDQGALNRSMQWHNPSRDVSYVRNRTKQLMDAKPVHCIWTGTRLSKSNFDIDHCLAWAAWPCADLWNLLPAKPAINRQKRDKLPSAEMLDRSAERIMGWWEKAWSGDEIGKSRFLLEAKASLPIFSKNLDLENVFDGLQKRRFAIRADQQIDEWTI